MIGSDAALNAAHNRTRIVTKPMAPIVVGLRELNGLPPTFTRRVFTGSGVDAAACWLIELHLDSLDALTADLRWTLPPGNVSVPATEQR